MSVDQWVSDELHSLVGMSDRTMTQFVIALAKKSTGAEDLIDKLRDNEAVSDITPAVRVFASELYNRVPHAAPRQAPKPKGPSEAERRVLEMNRLNARMTSLVEDEDDFHSKKASKREKHSRRRTHSDEEEEAPRHEFKKPTTNSARFDDDEYDIEKVDDDEERDKRERDEFATRLREKDKDKQKRGTDLKREEEKRNKSVSELREESRKSYLNKRTGDKIYELERQVQDDEMLWSGENLSAKEKKEVELRKKKLEYAKGYQDAEEITKVQRYEMPDPSKRKTVPDAYVEEERIKGGDGARWENDQLSEAIFHFGAKDRHDRNDDFALLLDEEIDFVQATALAGTEEKPVEVTAAERKKMSIEETRKSLPVYKFRKEFIEAVREHQVLIIVGETGSGKTTQLPQYLYEAGFADGGKRIGCTQPRRVAAMSVAARVADEMGTKLGGQVGYSIRFEDCTSDRTVLKYMTDGMLLREFLNEPDLASYSVMMIDEAHERTLHTDVLFGLVKDIARFRKDLKLLISSATLDADKFSKFFDDAPTFKIPGRRFPVDIFYTKAPEADYLDAAVVSVLQIHLTQPLPGDILVFLTGQEEIETVQEALIEKTKALATKIKELIILPVYANLPSDMQSKIFDPTPPNARKVVLATNIAETSVTIDGINYVIDPGFCKQNSFDARSGVEHLHVVTISKAAADQRAGRAGRTGPGKCFRLYTAWAYKHELEDQPIPEIQRVNLGNVVLLLKSLGIHDIVHFDFLDPPPQETLVIALEQLYALGALNHKGELTKLGRRMAEFPCDPQMSKMILASEKYQCSEEIITICAMMACNAAVFYRPKAMVIHADAARKSFWGAPIVGDHMALLNVYNKWKETNYSQQWCLENYIQHRTMKRARDIRDQLEGLLERVEIEPKSSTDSTTVRKAITAGYFFNCSKLDSAGHYKTVKNKHTVHIHPNSCLLEEMPRWLVYYELVFTSKEYMREVCEIESKWLLEVAPHYYKGQELEDPTNKKMPKQKGKSARELTGE
ncbi:unnamed protein product, partial [Mesorhabditis belari]|uniref:RNA helicase n=1 Tax=Mesorhabditis belari TaxID=2138241 RepID=A0AAF3EUU5_9BILA